MKYKYLTYILILIFASAVPVFAGGEFPEVTDPAPEESKIDERLYQESIGYDGYYGGGFYAEERYAAQPDFVVTYDGSTERILAPGFFVVDRQVFRSTFVSPFFGNFLVGVPGVSGGFAVGIGGFTFLRR